MGLFIGLMSGTSLDGVDAVLAADDTDSLRSLGHIHLPMPGPLREQLLALNEAGADEIHRSALAANALVKLYAQAVDLLLARTAQAASQVRAIGAHGQTVRHRPGEFDGTGYTVQLMNGALLAERTGIPVVCDFRSRDIAAGGQGAPLVPAFHAACFAQPGQDRAVLNLGGIANLTLLPAQGQGLGFGCGPGNVVMELWCGFHQGSRFDAGGAWAASGQPDAGLLARMLADPYFVRQPPKSTGRDLFNAGWLTAHAQTAKPATVMATLAELTAHSVAQALRRHAPRTSSLLVCGGGAQNPHLMARLTAALGPECPVQSTDSVGLPSDQVEALAFAWLARAFLQSRPGNMPAVTGASGERILGALYPGTGYPET